MAGYPVSDEIVVQNGENIYKTPIWWKAVLNYSVSGQDKGSETAIYLWHNDNGWSRKNKYVIKTSEAWADDRPIISALLRGDSLDCDHLEELPVSDYYSVSDAKTVFKEGSWWKSIVRINQKGDYETNEVIVYLWQLVDGDWRRRQKYAIKNYDDWAAEAKIISRFVEAADPESTGTSEPLPNDEKRDVGAQLASLKLKAHLSAQNQV